MLVSLGIGLTTLAAIAQIEGNLRRQIAGADAGGGAQLLLHRHPVRPGARLRLRWPSPSPGVEEVQARALACAPASSPWTACRPSRCSASPETALGAARRPRPDLCRDAARGHAAGRRANGGRRTTTARRWSPSTPALARGWGIGIGDVITVNVLGRDIDLTHRQPAARSSGAASASTSPWSPRPACWRRRRTPISPPSAATAARDRRCCAR